MRKVFALVALMLFAVTSSFAQTRITPDYLGGYNVYTPGRQ